MDNDGYRDDAMVKMYEIGASEAESATEKLGAAHEVGRSIGILQTLKCQAAYNDVIKYATLYRIKESKEYKRSGMTWEDFCDSVGESKKTIDNKLRDAGPLFEAFKEDSQRLMNAQLNEVRYLGRKISAEEASIDGDAIIVDGMRVKISPDNQEEIRGLIQTMKDREKAEKEALRAELSKEKSARDKIIRESVKGLETERDALVKELTSTKAKLPELETPEQVLAALESMKKTAFAFNTECRTLANLNREALKDRTVQGPVYGLLEIVTTTFEDLRLMIDEIVNDIDGTM